jgi:glucose/arabinose dehydrogenase
MTDLVRVPRAIPAVWSSGATTDAICGAAFVEGAQMGDHARPARGGRAQGHQAAAHAGGTGLRAVRTGPDGALYVTTSNRTNDALLRVAPAGS